MTTYNDNVSCSKIQFKNFSEQRLESLDKQNDKTKTFWNKEWFTIKFTYFLKNIRQT